MADRQNNAEDKVNFGAGLDETLADRILAEWEYEFPSPRNFNITLTPVKGHWLITVGGSGKKPLQLQSQFPVVKNSGNISGEMIDGALEATRQLVKKLKAT